MHHLETHGGACTCHSCAPPVSQTRYRVSVDGCPMMHSSVTDHSAEREVAAERMAEIYREINPGARVTVAWETL